eukprot:4752005-Pleurochrysis_carterae.AAC.2
MGSVNPSVLEGGSRILVTRQWARAREGGEGGGESKKNFQRQRTSQRQAERDRVSEWRHAFGVVSPQHIMLPLFPTMSVEDSQRADLGERLQAKRVECWEGDSGRRGKGRNLSWASFSEFVKRVWVLRGWNVQFAEIIRSGCFSATIFQFT